MPTPKKPTKKAAVKKAPAKPAPAKKVEEFKPRRVARPEPPATSSPAKYVKPTPAKQIEIPEGSGVFYNATEQEQEMYNVPARAQGFIEHGLANGQFQIRLNNLQGNPISIAAFYSVEVKPKTFQLS